MNDKLNPVEDRKSLTKAQFVMLRSLGREGSWTEGDHPLWKVSRHWVHSRKHHIFAMGACWELEDMGLVVSTNPLTCCEVHRSAKRFTLSPRGKAMLVRINSQRRAPRLAPWMPNNEILALAQACAAVNAVDPASAVRLILMQAQHENGLRLGSVQERFVKLVKSARTVAAGRSVQDLGALEEALRSSTNVPAEFVDSIAYVLKRQPKRYALADQPIQPTEQEQALS
ncbi:hypothetical protein K5D56_21605 [Pseudomonas cichorii]|nr:hypothetical protein [Pseudomonas cichorii]MBX8557064.1 hypothetical protein [Pseudomonas cichorii]MBX8591965.1 hypothetical protein [Pseudomonas cichorii]